MDVPAGNVHRLYIRRSGGILQSTIHIALDTSPCRTHAGRYTSNYLHLVSFLVKNIPPV
jgi:hypothetical protein